jgi:hypothetical protein
MSTIVNITAFSCTSNNESFVTSNSGWTTNSTNPPFGTDIFRVQNSGSPVSAYPSDGAPSIGYLYNTAPGSANQTVRATYRRVGTLVTDQFLYIAARMSTGDDWIAAAYVADAGGVTTGTVTLVKCVNGTRTTLMTQSGVGALASAGTSGTLELRVSGTAPTISVSAWWNAIQAGSTQTVTDATLDATGFVGFFNRVDVVGEGTGVHLTTFYAEDDTSSGTTAGPLVGSKLTNGLLFRGLIG